MKIFARGLVALAGGLALCTPLASASAQTGCSDCAPTVTTTYRYKTVYKVTYSTRYRDVTRIHVKRAKPAARATRRSHDRMFRFWRCPFTGR